MRTLSTLKTIEVMPLGGRIAAEIETDLGSIGPQEFELIHKAFLEHLVLVFPKQNLTAEEQVAFARRFGDLYLFPHGPGIEAHPYVLPINIPAGLGEGRWHSDATFDPVPPAISILAAKELPSRGGETMFANQYVAFESLSKGMQQMLGRLRAVHDGSSHGRAEDKSTHPVVRTHPETQRDALFVNAEFTRKFENMSVKESRGLLEFLTDHAHRPEFCYMHRWAPGDVVMWDNRCAQHYPVINRPSDELRRMWRVTVAGTPPVFLSP